MRNDTADSSVADAATVLSDMSMSFVNVEAGTEAGTQSNALVDVEAVAQNSAAPAISVVVTPKHDIIGQDSQISNTTACVTMKAIELSDDDDSHRAPIDLIVVLDISGSMNGAKLDLCKTTLELLLRVLYPDDRFGLICYSDTATVECQPQKMTDANKKRCLQKIKSLRTLGCTNISAAIGLAHQEMFAIENPNEVRSVFLLTDGHANAGISDKAGLVELAKNCFAKEPIDQQSIALDQVSEEGSKPKAVIVNKNSPITLHCFGYGKDHNASLLEEMCGVTQGGSYYFVENDTNVGTAFGDALGGILSVVAQNVSVAIEVPTEAKEKGVEIVDVWNDRKVKRENGCYSVTVGDFYSEESRDLLFDLALLKDDTLAPSDATPIPHATIVVSYIDTIRKIPVTSSPIVCAIARPMASAEVSASNEHVEAQLLRIEAVNVMKEADELARYGDVAQAKAKIQGQKQRIKSSGKQNDMLEQLSMDLGTLEEGFSSVSTYQARGSKYKSNMWRMHGEQRCMDSSVRSQANVYQNKKKKGTVARMFGK